MDEATDILRTAERLLARAELAELERAALAVAARAPGGLRLVPLLPGSDVIQLVVCDGVHLGRIRREYPHFLPERWIAVPLPPLRPRGPFRSAAAAARALIGLSVPARPNEEERTMRSER